jgi:F-type H+-transporting ATPase subunit b
MIWTLLTSAVAFAQEHGAEAAGGHEAVTIPWDSITVQTFNFLVLFGLLGFLLRKPMKKHFAERAQQYQELVDRAEKARAEAEHSNRQIKERLAKLESSSQQNVAQARAEAEELKARLMTEAKSLSAKLEQEAQRATAVELERAKAELRRELLGKALEASEEKLKKGLGSSDQKNLQNEFAQKIDVVGG